MAFEAFEKTPEVAPLLVRLYDTHNLYALAKDKESDGACSELTTIMTDLLSIKLSEKESELITDVLLALMKQALPASEWGTTQGWWAKTVQLDAEARGEVTRDGGKPLRWKRVK